MINSMFTANNGRRINERKSLPKWLAKIQTSQMTEKEKVVIIIITISMAVAVVIAMETLLAEDVEEAAAVAAGKETIVSICRMSNALIVARKATIPLTVPSQRRKMNDQTWFPKRISKTCFKLQ
jgi:predicted alpha/beta hydrolase family esterase